MAVMRLTLSTNSRALADTRGKDIVEGAGAQLRRSSAAEFAQVGRKQGIELRGAEVRNREFSDGVSARSRTVRLERQRKKMVENEREFNRLARGKIEVQLRGRKRPTGHKDMVRTRRKIGKNGVGRLIYNGREIGAEDRGMDLDRSWKIGLGFAKRPIQDSDGTKRATLRGYANWGERSAENEGEH